MPPDESRVAALERAAQRVLRANWREGVHRSGHRYAFSCPAPPRYRHQWYWDSCFHAIVMRRFDVARAREELRTLLRAGDERGLVPHTVFWDMPPLWRRAPFYATRHPFGCMATESIQTPLLALAWELVADASTDEPGFRTESISVLERHYDWLARERDPDGDGLITLILPDESGLDDSPKYDDVFGWMAHHRPGYFWLVERARRLRYRAPDIIERYQEHVEDVLVNVLYALSLRALSRLTGELRFVTRAERAERALLEKALDDSSGLFFDLAGPAERPVRVSTWSSLAPLALPGIPKHVRRRLVEEHLLNPRRYALHTGIPSVALEERSFTPGFDLWRCWRGAAWMVSAWLLVPPLRSLGYVTEADRIVGSLAAAVERYGYREYYNPLSGVGHAARNFGMATLLVELLDRASVSARTA